MQGKASSQIAPLCYWLAQLHHQIQSV